MRKIPKLVLIVACLLSFLLLLGTFGGARQPKSDVHVNWMIRQGGKPPRP